MSKNIYSVIECIDNSTGKWEIANLYSKNMDGSESPAQLIIGNSEYCSALFGEEAFDTMFDENGGIMDSIMGSGKSTWIIKEINQQPKLRYIYVGKYLHETQRIVDECPDAHFKQPSEYRFGSKQADFHSLLKDGFSIAITHELFRRLEFSGDEKEIIHKMRYRLILDEVPEVIEYIPVSKHDKNELLERYVDPGDDGFLVWKVHDYKGNHEEIKRKIELKTVINFNNKCFLWLFPIKLLLSFMHVDAIYSDTL